MSGYPINWNPFYVRIELLQRSGRSLSHDQAVKDADFREPIGAKVYGSDEGRGEPHEYRAQISYKQTELRARGETGEELVADGHLVFHTEDLNELSETDADLIPRRGDRITGIKDRLKDEWREVSYTIIHVVQKGHFRGKSRITFAYFEESPA